MMDKFEGKCHVRFKPGYNAQLQSRRLNLDPINAYHRPFVFYVAIQCLTVFYELVLQWQYGMQNARKRTLKKPLVFIHGIGAGVMCYGPFLHALLQQLGDRPVFFVELPFVSMRCCEDVPTMQEMTFAVESMLQDHGYTSATFVGHSLGSAVTSWCCKQIPHMVDGVVLIDPICFMLHYSDVCHNFVYREPETVSQAIVKYFASSELYISHYISRQFYWFETALYLTSKHPAFPSLVPNTTPMPKNVKVYLSECDNIVNSPRVSTYLQKNGIPVHWMYGLDHASFLFHPSWQQHIVHTLKMFTQ
ncbi:alpha/beta-hydrolase [Hesseltinella vesiculosa]|uniref:Alpha/beta-hydrolase n=1 Tax=Hesseltinella vesiculosa TaxID=101127 RepID=A0A1X2GRV5_9FUNG|nr:alpha/beta-hydrolase [Hesseltinella vesiculosa]